MRRTSRLRERRATRKESFRRIGRAITDYLLITVGAIMVALAADLFLIPNRVVSGGATGVATILYYVLGTRVGLATLVINVPLLIMTIIWGGGWRAAIRTVYGVVVMSLAIDFLQPYLPAVTQDPLLYTLYGGLLDGLGVGLVFRAKGTTGGADIIARIVNRFWGIRLGRTILITNLVIMGSAAIFFGLEPVLYAILFAAVSSRVVDLVQEGVGRSRSAMIISSHAQEVTATIIAEMGRGVTVLHGEGGYTGVKRPVLLCAISQQEVTRLRRLVQRIDPQAFVILSPASEVLGQGFSGFETN